MRKARIPIAFAFSSVMVWLKPVQRMMTPRTFEDDLPGGSPLASEGWKEEYPPIVKASPVARRAS
jgi:hypothetical protein